MKQLREQCNKYLNQAVDFLYKTNSTIKIEYSKTDLYFPDDKCPRDIYNITLIRGNRKYTFTFGNSLRDSGFYVQIGRTKHPLPYNLLNSKNLRNYIKNHIDYNFIYSIDKIHYPVAPTAYDILACLEKYDYESFEDFCSQLGYDTDSRNAERIYNACKDQYLHLISLYNEEEMEMLKDIQ